MDWYLIPGEPPSAAIAAAAPFSLAWVSHAEDAAGGTTITHTGISFGAASSNRTLVAAIVGRPTSVAATVISSVTIGGVSATQVSGAYIANGTNAHIADIWQAAVPSGTSGNVVVTYANATSRSGIDLYSLNTNTTAATAAGGVVVDPGPSSISKTIVVPAGGAAIAIYSDRSTSAVTATTWTNANLDNDALNIGGVGTVVSSASTSTPGSVTITANTVGNSAVSPIILTAAAWGP